MRRYLIAGVIGLLLLAGIFGLLFTFGFILSARSALDNPTDLQIRVADMGKNFLVPGDVQSRTNPVTLAADKVAAARRLYTARCVVCHNTDGKGNTATGSHLYPRAADLTIERTQGKSDGMLFWIVGNGLPHTGMPGWKTVLSEDEIWQIVAYMRLLPKGVEASVEQSPTPAPAATTPPPTATSLPATSAAIAVAAATATPIVASATLAPTRPAATSVATLAPSPVNSATAVPATAGLATATIPVPASASATVASAVAPPALPTITAAVKPANIVTVTISDYIYMPDSVTVSANTQVIWINKDDDAHTVTSEEDAKLFDSDEFGKDKSFAHIFDKPGTYKYYCLSHDYMHGVVIVK
ncbi:MAG: c-type cytochrome [Chloroflexi bacterium]|nr:c-type cytochrome [Chloroflexota bacterium]